MKLNYWWFIITIFFILSCRSGKKLYEKGLYDKSVVAFARKLKRKPNDPTSHQLMPLAYDSARKQHMGKVKEYRATNDEYRYEKMHAELSQLQSLYTSIHDRPAALAVVNPKDYTKALSIVAEKAAALHYHLGDSLLNLGGALNARKAWYEFDNTLKMVADYGDAAYLRDSAYYIGHIQVLVTYNSVPDCCQGNMQGFVTELARQLQNAPDMSRFVTFATDTDGDERLTLNLDLSQQYTREDHIEQDRSQEIVVSSTTDSTGKVISEERATVTAKVYFNDVVVTYETELHYELEGASPGKNSVSNNYRWENTWNYYDGDERALTAKDLQQMGGEKQDVPHASDFFDTLINPAIKGIVDDISWRYSASRLER